MRRSLAPVAAFFAGVVLMTASSAAIGNVVGFVKLIGFTPKSR